MSQAIDISISDFSISTSPVPGDKEPLFYAIGNKCDATFLTHDAHKAVVYESSSSAGGLPITVEVGLDWNGRTEIPLVQSDEVYTGRNKMKAIDTICQWAANNDIPAIYYNQPGGDNELLVIDEDEVEIYNKQYHIQYPSPSADIGAMSGAGYEMPTPSVVSQERIKPPRPPIGMPRLPGR